MAYPHLLALIDEKIARLTLARELLSSPELVLPELYPASPSPEEPMHEEQPAFAGEANGAFAPANGNGHAVITGLREAAPAAESRAVQRVRGFQRRERRTVRRALPAEPSALRNTMPSGPVFVPAARVQPAQPAMAAMDQNLPQPLDAAALARRWLNSSN